MAQKVRYGTAGTYIAPPFLGEQKCADEGTAARDYLGGGNRTGQFEQKWAAGLNERWEQRWSVGTEVGRGNRNRRRRLERRLLGWNRSGQGRNRPSSRNARHLIDPLDALQRHSLQLGVAMRARSLALGLLLQPAVAIAVHLTEVLAVLAPLQAQHL